MIERNLDWPEKTIGRNMGIKGDSQRKEESYRETSYCLREYIYHHEQNIARNMSIQGAFYEVLAWPMITKYYKLGGLNNRHLFLIIWRLGSSRPRYRQI